MDAAAVVVIVADFVAGVGVVAVGVVGGETVRVRAACKEGGK